MGGGVLTIRDPLDGHFSRSYPVDSVRFQSLRDDLISMPSNGTDSTISASSGRVETVCLDPASGWIETVLDDKLRRAHFDYCQNEAKYVDEILDFAAPFDSACAPLVAFEGWPARALQKCMHLAGKSRLAAANAYVAAEKLGQGKDVGRWVSPDATLIFDGTPPIKGRTAVARAWETLLSDKTNEYYYYHSTDASDDAGQIVVDGLIVHSRGSGDSEISLSAISTQFWTVDSDSALRLVNWRIGRFEPSRRQQQRLCVILLIHQEHPITRPYRRHGAALISNTSKRE